MINLSIHSDYLNGAIWFLSLSLLVASRSRTHSFCCEVDHCAEPGKQPRSCTFMWWVTSLMLCVTVTLPDDNNGWISFWSACSKNVQGFDKEESRLVPNICRQAKQIFVWRIPHLVFLFHSIDRRSSSFDKTACIEKVAFDKKETKHQHHARHRCSKASSNMDLLMARPCVGLKGKLPVQDTYLHHLQRTYVVCGCYWVVFLWRHWSGRDDLRWL